MIFEGGGVFLMPWEKYFSREKNTPERLLLGVLKLKPETKPIVDGTMPVVVWGGGGG